MTGIEALLLQARLAWNGDEAERGMNSAGKSASDLEAKISGAMKKIGGAIAAAFTVDAIKNFVVSAIDAGAEVSAEMSAFEQIMGDYADEASSKVAGIADATGMVSTRLTPYMTSMTAKFKGLGYDVQDATDMAARGLNLAADGAAFWDMSLDESTSHLNSFINGSYEGGEAIGLFANDTQMATYAVEQGLIKDTKAWANLDEATKQATRLEYAENMYKQSGATGQAAKESEQYANVMANLQEHWRQFQALIGKPIIENIAIPVMKKLGEVLESLSGLFTDLATIWQGRIQPALSKVGRGLRNVWNAIKNLLPDVRISGDEWDNLKEGLVTFVEDALEKVAAGLDKLAEILPALVPYIEGVVAAFAAFKVGQQIQSVVQGFQQARLAVSLFAAGQSSAEIATKLSTGALKAHEIVVGLLTGKITLAQLATSLWTKVQTGLNAVLSANPIALVVMAIAALVAAFVIAYNKSETFRNFIDGLWATIKDKLEPVIQSVSGFISNTLVPAFQAVGDWITGTVVPALQQLGSWLQEHILSAIQAVAGWISGTLVPTLQNWGDYIMTNIVPALQELFAAIQERVQPILEAVSGFITNTVVPAFRRIIEVVQQILTAAAPILEAIKTAFNTAWTVIKTVAETVWNNIKATVETVLGVIKGIIQTVMSVIRGDWNGAWNAIKGIGVTIWNGIKAVASNLFEGLKSVVSTVLGGIMSIWTNIWNAIKGVASVVWNAIKSVASSVFDSIKSVVTSVLNSIKSTWTSIWNTIKGTAVTVWNAIKTFVSNAIEAVKSTISRVINSIRSTWSTVWGSIKDKVSSIWDSIKSAVTSKIDTVKTTVSSAVDKIKEWLSFSGLVNTVKGIFDDVKNGIKDKIESAKETVKGIVDKIVGFFTGAKFSWPSIPMPHFGISPKGWHIGDLLEGSIPKLSIEWYAKAMDDAMVLDQPTIFGMTGGQMLGGGEAGREVVSGEAHLIELIGQAVAQNNAAMLDVLYKILGAIRKMDEGMYDQIVDALTDGVRFDLDGREFGRLVRAYA